MKFHDPEHKFERNYWRDCTNTFMEEQKHFVQARLMGIKINGCSLDAMGKRILDIGGGPVSMLLKTQNLAFGMVCDPITYPAWVYERYRAKGISCVERDRALQGAGAVKPPLNVKLCEGARLGREFGALYLQRVVAVSQALACLARAFASTRT